MGDRAPLRESPLLLSPAACRRMFGRQAWSGVRISHYCCCFSILFFLKCPKWFFIRFPFVRLLSRCVRCDACLVSRVFHAKLSPSAYPVGRPLSGARHPLIFSHRLKSQWSPVCEAGRGCVLRRVLGPGFLRAFLVLVSQVEGVSATAACVSGWWVPGGRGALRCVVLSRVPGATALGGPSGPSGSAPPRTRGPAPAGVDPLVS